METNGRKPMEANNFRIEFRHQRGEWKVPYKKGKAEKEALCTRRTVCFIVPSTAPQTADIPQEWLSQGIAYCSPADTFDHEVGRQQALLEALREIPNATTDAPLPKNLSRHLFTAYTQRPGALPWVIDDMGHANLQLLQRARVAFKARRRRVEEVTHIMALAGRLGAATPLPPGWPPIE